MTYHSSKFLNQLSKRVLLCDGGTGTLFQAQSVDVDKDLLGHENCFEVLNLTRPDIVEKIHREYLDAGADCIETNTFGANKVVLGEFDLVDKVYEINLKAAQIARRVADEYGEKFVIGSVGPGTKLPSLSQITYDELVDSYAEQARGLLAGKVDLLLLETNQDLLTIKAEIEACKMAKKECGDSATPIFAQVTMDVTGKMLVGSDIASVVTSLQAMDIDGIGLNCGIGPVEMAEHVQYISQHWDGYISVMPNAGLPMLVDGKTSYPLGLEELAKWQKRFIENNGVNFIGGCCGTTPKHIAAIRKMLDENPMQKKREVKSNAAVSSLFKSVNLEQESAVFAIGERANANGSKKFRILIEAENFDGMLAVAKEQEREGSHAIDVCCACVGRDEARDMERFISLCRGQLLAPIVIDSTNEKVIEESLKLLGGKSIINSINLESGFDKARAILKLAKQFGTAVIALTIDEDGMAKTVEKKAEVAKRLYQLAVNEFHLPPSDLLFDPLVFTICTGTDDDREHAINTLDAIIAVQDACPGAKIILGLSNVSFGLKPIARRVLNSVFLHHAILRGVTAAIMHSSKIKPLHQIPEDQKAAAENLIFNRRENDEDPLLHFIKLFENIFEEKIAIDEKLSVEEKLKRHILNGDKLNLEKNLNEALKKYSPLEIINDHLLSAMQIVGELFGRGETQLPFVLQSAETMKAAVNYLQQFIKQSDQKTKGTLLLATVKGDVHDIGKNLVSIILSNNGYCVIDIGIKQSINQIIEAAKKEKPDAIGMSGLLVQSTVIMKENLEIMREQGMQIPVILGGAALTKNFVEQDCQKVYGDARIYYAKDAFAALYAMEEIIAL